jgi:hypothetical protein
MNVSYNTDVCACIDNENAALATKTLLSILQRNGADRLNIEKTRLFSVMCEKLMLPLLLC